MFGDSYILKVATNTQNEMVVGLSAFFLNRFRAIEQENIAFGLAAGISMFVFGEPPKEGQQKFRHEYANRIESEARALETNLSLREVMSGAAYNMGYGSYVESGGGRLMNKYLNFFRLESQTSPDVRLLASTESELDFRKKEILQPFRSLKALSLWIPRSYNPNELEYYRAVHSFAVAQGVFKA